MRHPVILLEPGPEFRSPKDIAMLYDASIDGKQGSEQGDHLAAADAIHTWQRWLIYDPMRVLQA
jgi:hypothetical protein